MFPLVKTKVIVRHDFVNYNILIKLDLSYGLPDNVIYSRIMCISKRGHLYQALLNSLQQITRHLVRDVHLCVYFHMAKIVTII